MPAKGSEIVDIDVTLKHETEKAWLVYSTCGQTPHEEWISKSVAELERGNGASVTVTLPRWMAEAKGLV